MSLVEMVGRRVSVPMPGGLEPYRHGIFLALNSDGSMVLQCSVHGACLSPQETWTDVSSSALNILVTDTAALAGVMLGTSPDTEELRRLAALRARAEHLNLIRRQVAYTTKREALELRADANEEIVKAWMLAELTEANGLSEREAAAVGAWLDMYGDGFNEETYGASIVAAHLVDEDLVVYERVLDDFYHGEIRWLDAQCSPYPQAVRKAMSPYPWSINRP